MTPWMPNAGVVPSASVADSVPVTSANTSTAAVSVTVPPVGAAATGRSFAPVIVTVKVASVVAVPSPTRTVKVSVVSVATPLIAPASGTKT